MAKLEHLVCPKVGGLKPTWAPPPLLKVGGHMPPLPPLLLRPWCWISKINRWISKINRWISKINLWVWKIYLWIWKINLWISKNQVWISKINLWISKNKVWNSKKNVWNKKKWYWYFKNKNFRRMTYSIVLVLILHCPTWIRLRQIQQWMKNERNQRKTDKQRKFLYLTNKRECRCIDWEEYCIRKKYFIANFLRPYDMLVGHHLPYSN